MKKIQIKLVGILIAIIVVTIIFPIQVLGANENLQIVQTNEERYIIYIKDIADTKFEFAITQNPEEIDIDFQQSEIDGEGNQVVFITKEKYNEIKEKENYLFIRKDGEIVIEGQNLDFSEMFTTKQMQEVEQTTKRIITEVKSDIIETDEDVDGVKVKVTVGGLKIIGNEDSTYYYSSTKLPSEQYSKLKELADRINQEYEKIDMYSRIELAKQFYDLYESLGQEQNWQEVKDYTVMQPSDAKKDEQYIVYLKEVDANQNEKIDVKFMTSYREENEEKIPGRTETKIVKETAKLPITGDSMILFVIVAVILAVAILVFIRMKRLQEQKVEK